MVRTKEQKAQYAADKKAQYASDPEYRARKNAYDSAYAKANTEAFFWHRIKSRYGLSRDAYEALLASQRGLCAICGVQDKLHIDHDHSTGEVRGLLCGPCNRALGHFGDNADGLRVAIAYLERNG